MKRLIYVLFLLPILIGCSTEKNTAVNRFYHNTTAYYNGYFNAREIIKEKNKEFEKTRAEDYQKILPINRYPNEEESKGWFPDMDLAIEKTSKVITKHAMPREKVAKYARTEYGKWMDENWLVVGQSHFYKREYDTAINVFKYVIKMYEKDPSKYKAKLWLARTYLEMEDFGEANKYLQEIVNDKEASERKDERKEKRKKRRNTYKKKGRRKKSKIKVIQDRQEEREKKSIIIPFPKELEDDLASTLADYYLKKGELEESIFYLDSAISVTKRKKTKVRYRFIRAQIHQELGKKTKAYEDYSYVIKRNAPYQMIFYSKINRALMANSSDRNSLRKELLKLAKDDKYIEFKDQIYYALAELELQDVNKPKAIEYLQLSASAPSSNVTQKGKTYIKLADLYFEDKAYLDAQRYYDSSLTSLPNTYPNYDAIKDKSESLTSLVGYINNVKLQDSLQEIAGLDEKKRLDRIEEILYAKKLQDEKDKEELNNAKDNNAPPDNFLAANNNSKGKFWMYNPQSKAFGYNEFKSVWGDVKLEDNWRRKNKNKSLAGTNDNNENTGPVVSDKEIAAFADKLPVSPEQLEKSNIEIINSLYLSGLVYRDKLKDSPEAVKSFDEVRRRYHPNNKAIKSMYQLYKTLNDQSKYKEANIVKDQIIESYPNSEEAKILKDPDYASKAKNDGAKDKNLYTQVYTLINNNQHQAAIGKINSALSQKEPNPYECKLRYLKVRAYGGLSQLDSVESSLKAVIKFCPNDTLSQLAQNTLNEMKNIKKKQDSEKAREDIFKFAPETQHFFMVLVPNGKYDMNKMKSAISNFNSASFGSKSLKVNATFLDTKTQAVLVKTFANKEEAKSYYVAYKVNNKELKDFNVQFEYFTISAKNFSQLFISKDLAKYKEFFGKYYVE